MHSCPLLREIKKKRGGRENKNTSFGEDMSSCSRSEVSTISRLPPKSVARSKRESERNGHAGKIRAHRLERLTRLA